MGVKVAVDGPAGSGKSTVAKSLAEKYNLIYVDTGAMYRAATWFFLKEETDSFSGEICAKIKEVSIAFMGTGNNLRIICNGVDVTEEIRTPRISAAVSSYSALPCVRKHLVDIQKKICRENSEVIMDGRDIGTVVIPDADFKFFLTADNTVRAERRFRELSAKIKDISYQEILRDMAERDKKDTEREQSPLKPAEDSIIIDTSGLSPDEVTAEISYYLDGVK